jgi:hypothetical protein
MFCVSFADNLLSLPLQCLSLLNGPLCSDTHMAAALKTRFFRRILAAASPLRSGPNAASGDLVGIGEQPWAPASVRVMRLAVCAYHRLLSSPVAGAANHDALIESGMVLDERRVSP